MQFLPYICLWLTLLVTLITQSRVFLGLGLIISFIAGMLIGTMTWIGLLALLLTGMLALLYFHKIFRKITFIGMLIGTFLLYFRALPGFHNLLVISAQHTSKLATAFTMHLNFDKVSMGYILLFASQIPLSFRYFFNRQILLKTFPIIVMCMSLLMGAGLLTGYVAFDFKIPSFTLIWVLNNLFFVCVAEEVLFRGILQQTFMHVADKYKIHFIWPLMLASVIFGLAHFKAGVIFIGLASVAGMFYGYAYYKTQRLEASILTHFMVNFIHFLFFTYPARII